MLLTYVKSLPARFSFESKLFFTTILVIMCTMLFFMERSKFCVPTIRSDGIGYHYYLPEVFIHHELSAKKLIETSFKDGIPYYTGIVQYEPTGRYTNIYPIGEAVLLTPFFLAADFATKHSSYPRDGYSHYYQVFLSVAALMYTFVGLLFLYKVLRRWFKESTSLLTLTCILFGTDLIEYATCDSIFTHAFSFCLFAVFLWFVVNFYERWTFTNALGVGISSALIFLVRNTNIYYVAIFFLLYGVTNYSTLKGRIALLVENKKLVAIMGITAFIVVLPQLYYWKHTGGHFLFNPYKYVLTKYYHTNGSMFDFRHPYLYEVLFSVRKGFFFWAPLMLLSVPGLYIMVKKAKSFAVPTYIYLVLHLLIVSTWFQWWYGGSYGHRAFVESLVVISIPLAATLSYLKRNFISILVYAAIVFCILLNLVQIYQYWWAIIPDDGMYWEYYKSIFLRIR